MTDGPLSVRIRTVGNVVVLDLTGRMIMGEAERALRATVRELVEAGKKNLAFNLSEVKYIDSSGIGCLTAAWISAHRKGARCRLFAVPSKVMLMLKISRLDSIFEVLPDEASALSGN